MLTNYYYLQMLLQFERELERAVEAFTKEQEKASEAEREKQEVVSFDINIYLIFKNKLAVD